MLNPKSQRRFPRFSYMFLIYAHHEKEKLMKRFRTSENLLFSLCYSSMKLMSGVSLAPGQLSGQPGAAPGARAIQLPSSVSKPGGGGGGVPVARVTPQQHGASGNVSTSYVTFVPANSRFVWRCNIFQLL